MYISSHNFYVFLPGSLVLDTVHLEKLNATNTNLFSENETGATTSRLDEELQMRTECYSVDLLRE